MTNRTYYGLNNRNRVVANVCVNQYRTPQVRVMYRNKLKVVLDMPEYKDVSPMEELVRVCLQKFYSWLDQPYGN